MMCGSFERILFSFNLCTHAGDFTSCLFFSPKLLSYLGGNRLLNYASKLRLRIWCRSRVAAHKELREANYRRKVKLWSKQVLTRLQASITFSTPRKIEYFKTQRLWALSSFCVAARRKFPLPPKTENWDAVSTITDSFWSRPDSDFQLVQINCSLAN